MRRQGIGSWAAFEFLAAGEDNAQPFVCHAKDSVPVICVLPHLSRIVGPLILEETTVPRSDRSRRLLKGIFGPSYREKERKATRPSFVLHQTDPAEAEGLF